MPDPETLPTFIVLGEQKCGTGWIRDRLREHPGLYMAPREVNFFNRKTLYAKGLGHYARTFAPGVDRPVRGEKSPEYFWQRSGLERYNQDIFGLIDAALPEARVVVVLRDPVARAVSALLHHTRHSGRRIHPRVLKENTVSEILLSGRYDYSHLGILERGFYADRLAEAQRVFGERLLVMVLEEDIIGDPRGGLARLLDHIGAAPFDGFSYASNEKSGKPSYEVMWLSHYLVPFRPLIRRLDVWPAFRARMGPNCADLLWARYAPDVARVEQLLDRPLEPVWRPS